jgi:hypothetical protein
MRAAARQRQQPPPALVELRDVPGPVDTVEEPVEDEEQHTDRHEPDDRLELLAVAGQLGEHRLGEDERDRARQQGDQRADQHRPAPTAGGAAQAGHHRGQDQHRLEPLAEDDHRGIRDYRGRARPLAERAGALLERLVER